MPQFNTPPAFRFSSRPALPPPRSARHQSCTGIQDGAANTPDERSLSVGQVQDRRPRSRSPQKKLTKQVTHDEGHQECPEESRVPGNQEVTKPGDHEEDKDMLDYQPPPANQAAENQHLGTRQLLDQTIGQDTRSDPVPKRRRLESASDTRLDRSIDTSTPHTPSRPRFRDPAPRSVQNNTRTTPSFNNPRPFHAVLSSTHTSSTPASSNLDVAPISSRPRFILPSSTSYTSPSPFTSAPNLNPETQPQPQPPATALPDIFSPHKRKHERFAPGGWAAQVRNWVLDVSIAGGEHIPDAFGLSKSSSRRREQKEVEMVIRKVHTAGVGVVGMVKGEVIGGKDGSVGVVLVGEGGEGGGRRGGTIERRSAESHEGVREGGTVVLGLPAWEVDVDVISSGRDKDKEKWMICPVWKTK